MRRFVAFAAIAGSAAMLWASSATAGVRPAPLAGAAPMSIELVQFRLPWESRAASKRRTKQPARTGRPVRKPPAAAARSKPKAATPKPGAPAAQVEPMDAALPPATGPLAVAAPRGTTQREADGWALVAAQVAGPGPVPELSPEGPAPISASALALLATLTVGDQTTSRRTPLPVAAADEEAETPDRHVPMPPRRPGRSGAPVAAAPPVDGLAPEGGGLSADGGLAREGGLSPEDAPMPPRRPGDMAALEPEADPEPPPGPTAPDIALPVIAHEDDADCRALVSEGVAEAERIPPIEGPGVCGGGPVVSLAGVKRRDGTLVKIRPAATLRCAMARALAAFLRDDVAPAAEASGAQLARLDIAGSFQCRGRNGAFGGRMSEHGRANAVDLAGFGFADGTASGVFSPDLPKALVDTVRTSACERFSTVLGPGSDGFHETHLHVDMQPRRSTAKLCQWDDPEVAKAKQQDRQDAQGLAAAKSGEGKSGEGKSGEGKAPDRKTDDDDAPDRRAAARRKADQADAPLPKRSSTP